MERVMGIEPTRPAWKAGILPLNYTRILLVTRTRIELASPAWQAGALTIVLHLRSPSVEIVSLDILTWKARDVKRFNKISHLFSQDFFVRRNY